MNIVFILNKRRGMKSKEISKNGGAH